MNGAAINVKVADNTAGLKMWVRGGLLASYGYKVPRWLNPRQHADNEGLSLFANSVWWAADNMLAPVGVIRFSINLRITHTCNRVRPLLVYSFEDFHRNNVKSSTFCTLFTASQLNHTEKLCFSALVHIYHQCDISLCMIKRGEILFSFICFLSIL